MPEPQTVWIVDDEVAVATLVSRHLEDIGEFQCRVFTSSSEFLDTLKPGVAACVVTDIRMPGADGPALQQQLLAVDSTISIVFLTGHADVPTTVQVMEQAAVTLLQKPYEPAELVAAVRKAVLRCQKLRQEQAERLESQRRLDMLSEDEREVLQCLVSGLSNKAIAFKLALSPRTLDRRRQTILQTMGVDSVVELASLLERLRGRGA